MGPCILNLRTALSLEKEPQCPIYRKINVQIPYSIVQPFSRYGTAGGCSESRQVHQYVVIQFVGLILVCSREMTGQHLQVATTKPFHAVSYLLLSYHSIICG